MKFFTNKKFLFKLILSICLCLTISNFGTTIVLEAATNPVIMLEENIESVEVVSRPAVIQNYGDSEILAWGGQLLQPIIELIMAIGDSCMNVIQSSIMGGTDSYIAVDKSRNWILIIVVILIAVVSIALLVVGLGGVAALAAKLSTVLTAKAAAGGALGLAAKGILGVGGASLAAAKGAIFVAATTFGVVTSLTAVSVVDEACFPEVTVLPLYSISPQELFRGDILLFDVNFFNPKEVKVSDGAQENTYILNGQEIKSKDQVYYYENQKGEKIITSQQSSAFELKKTISKWYYYLRNIAMIVLILVLVYVGIRMLISSVASEKAKYKQMIFDWGVALCLVFTIHYVMVFAVNLNESFVRIIKDTSNLTSYDVTIDFRNSNHIEKYEEAIEDGGLSPDDFIIETSNEEGTTFKQLHWPTNLMGYTRVQAQMMDGSAAYVGYALCYVILVLFTVYFTFAYAKRLLYITFLTVIAPLVAITYPIDKINDGKAQGFDIWMKEYIFNLLIQPLHLMLYTVLISMAFDFAGSNVIYSIVAIGFMMPAEKFLRKMFNFEKANTPGLLGGAAGAALVMSGLNTLSRMGASNKGGKGNGDSNAKAADTNKIRGYDSNKNFDNVMEGAALNDNSTSSQVKLGAGNGVGNNTDTGDINKEDNYRQMLLDAEAEAFGTEDFDAQSYDVSARALSAEEDSGMQYSEDEYRQILLDSGYEGEELDKMMEESGFGLVPETNNQVEDVDNSQEEIEKSKFSRAMSAWGKGISVTGKRTLKNMPGMAGTGLKLVGGLTGAGIGLAAGISSGDISKTIQYTTAGGMAGKAISNMPVNKIKGEIERSNKSQEQFEKDYYGTDYSKRRREQLDEAFKMNKEKRNEYAEELGIDKKYEQQLKQAKLIKEQKDREQKIKELKQKRKEELDKIMEEANEYRKYNITDDNIIIKAMKIDKDKQNNKRDSKDKIASAMIASRAKNQKEVDDYIKRLKNQGVTEEAANRIARNAKIINPNI